MTITEAVAMRDEIDAIRDRHECGDADREDIDALFKYIDWLEDRIGDF